jgi:hypothetical protein
MEAKHSTLLADLTMSLGQLKVEASRDIWGGLIIITVYRNGLSRKTNTCYNQVLVRSISLLLTMVSANCGVRCSLTLKSAPTRAQALQRLTRFDPPHGNLAAAPHHEDRALVFWVNDGLELEEAQ